VAGEAVLPDVCFVADSDEGADAAAGEAGDVVVLAGLSFFSAGVLFSGVAAAGSELAGGLSLSE
jgi:hypothetical protein